MFLSWKTIKIGVKYSKTCKVLALVYLWILNLTDGRPKVEFEFQDFIMTSSRSHRDVIMKSSWRHQKFFELFKVMSLEEYQARTNKFMDEIAATSVLPDILAYVRECTTCSVLPKVTGDMSGDVMPPQVRFHPSVKQGLL